MPAPAAFTVKLAVNVFDPQKALQLARETSRRDGLDWVETLADAVTWLVQCEPNLWDEVMEIVEAEAEEVG